MLNCIKVYNNCVIFEFSDNHTSCFSCNSFPVEVGYDTQKYVVFKDSDECKLFLDLIHGKDQIETECFHNIGDCILLEQLLKSDTVVYKSHSNFLN